MDRINAKVRNTVESLTFVRAVRTVMKKKNIAMESFAKEVMQTSLGYAPKTWICKNRVAN